ncbi:universal stress protein [Streptomyces laurentii]|uniref:universal stress protein n=1 Tax=Streptomyces laurentii TaxID=39478 RepID=UPI0036CB702B
MGNDVVIGVDPREPSVPALDWAADEALRRDTSLRMVTAVPPVHDRLSFDALAHRSGLRMRAASVLANAEDLVRETHGGPRTVTELVDGAPATVLYERAVDAAVVVLGSRRLGRTAEVLSEGSVVVPLTARSPCPVAVIRAPAPEPVHPPLVVVGVDGSRDCRAAIAFAVAEAGLREARLQAVWVWPRPLLSRDDVAEGLAERRRLLAEAVAGWAERRPDVGIEQEVVRGHPVEELARAAGSAVAVVVGRRGRGGYSGMRLGSTAHGLLRHATCPVIAVPLPEATETDGTPVGAAQPRLQGDQRTATG